MDELPSSLTELPRAISDTIADVVTLHEQAVSSSLESMLQAVVPLLYLVRACRLRFNFSVERHEELVFFGTRRPKEEYVPLLAELAINLAPEVLPRRSIGAVTEHRFYAPHFVDWGISDEALIALAGSQATSRNTIAYALGIRQKTCMAIHFGEDEEVIYAPADFDAPLIINRRRRNWLDKGLRWPARPFLLLFDAIVPWATGAFDRGEGALIDGRRLGLDGKALQTLIRTLLEVLSRVDECVRRSTDSLILGIDDFKANLQLRLDGKGDLASRPWDEDLQLSLEMEMQTKRGRNLLGFSLFPREHLVRGELLDTFVESLLGSEDRALDDFVRSTLSLPSDIEDPGRTFLKDAMGSGHVAVVRILRSIGVDTVIIDALGGVAGVRGRILFSGDFSVHKGKASYLENSLTLEGNDHQVSDLVVEYALKLSARLLDWRRAIKRLP